MCNLYSITKSQDAVRRWFGTARDMAGNLPPLPDVYPDSMAPIIRTDGDGARELRIMRWGFPPPPNLGTRLVTNIRNTNSPYWRGWLTPRYRCLVPATSFCEWTDARPKVPNWFAFGDDRPLFAFAGIWRPWTGTRGTKTAPVEGEHLLFSFLTTEPNDVVRPIHAKAMPVILTEPRQFEAWLTAPVGEALRLQKSFPNDRLKIVATGLKADEVVEHAIHV